MTPLPLECDVRYQPGFLSDSQADELFTEIVSGFDVQNRIIKLFDGTDHVSETGTFLFADPDLTSFEMLPEVWGKRSPWTDSLAQLRDRIYTATGSQFRVARCVFYADGSEGMDFHSDLPAYGDTSQIASLSLGAEREFVLRKKEDPGDQFSIRLSKGSLLFMGSGCQDLYEHALPHDKACQTPRLNVTFRKFGWD